MQKGILLLFISNYKENSKELSYHVEALENESYLGIQTNDAPVKYLLHQAVRNGDIIQKIFCIVTKEVKETGDFKKFQKMVNDYIDSHAQLNLLYQNVPSIEFCQIDYDTSILETSNRAKKIYSQIAKYLLEESTASVYIDYTGGLRDTSFLMTTIIRYMEYYNITCKEIVYSKYNKISGTIHSINCMYQMFRLLNGVDQFVRTGNAELLGECYQQEEDADTKEILKLLIQFSRVISLCDVRQMDKILPKLSNKLRKYEKKEKQGFFTEIFADLIIIIRKKLYMEEENEWGYPQIIRWCIDNNMLQQALTLYIEKMPKYYYDSHLLNLPDIKQRKISFGGTIETAAFYTNLFDDYLKDEKLKEFETAIKELDTKALHSNLDALQYIKKKYRSKEMQRAVDRLNSFLNRYFEKGFGKRKNQEEMPKIYKKGIETANKGTGFLNEMKNKSYLIHYFFYNDLDAYEKTQVGTYESKVVALDRVKENIGKSEQSNVSNQVLYEMMRYYCALKLMRNRINHASESDKENDEKNAIERLEKFHGICMEMEFQNIKTMIEMGLKAHNKQKIKNKRGRKLDY